MFFKNLLLFLILPALLHAASPDDAWEWSQGNAHVQVDTASTGRITRWSIGEKQMISPAPATGTLQWRDVQGRVWHFKAAKALRSENGLELTGAFTAGEEQIPASLSYEVQENGRQVVMGIELPSTKAEEGAQVEWQLPLALNPRKRVFFLSDHGLPWETRYFFQLTYEPRAGIGRHQQSVLKTPDRNEWRYFALEQFAPQAYRLWKSESDTTAPLIMHEGRQPAPIVQIYDEAGGVSVEYPRLRAASPSSLRVDAAGGGTVQITFSTGAKQTVILSAQESEEAVLKAREDFAQRYASQFTPRPDFQTILQEPRWLTQAPEEKGRPLYVSGGYPFARGTLRKVDDIAVHADSEAVPLQVKALAYWPDRSIKWAHLLFPIDPAKASAAAPAPRISLRKGTFLPVKVEAHRQEKPPSGPTLAVQTGAKGELTVRNGDLEIELATGADWLRRLTWKGETVVDASLSSAQASAYYHYRLAPTLVFPFAKKPQGGKDDPGILKVDHVSVEESGPLRAVIRLEGLTTNQEPTRVVLRMEFLAGRPEIRLTHTAIFRFLDPRKTFLTGMGLEFPLPKALGSAHQELFQRTVEYRVLKENGNVVDGGGKQPDSWLSLESDGTALTAAIRNFRQSAPKALVAEKGRLRFELWPHQAEPMDVRRYSNYLHAAQLEGPTGMKEDWVQKVYYTTEPFFGVSRTHEMLLAFGTGEEKAAAAVADFESPPLLYAGWNAYTEAQVVLPAATARQWPRAWDTWTHLTQFFLYHRELHRWYGFWNYGDFRHRFRSGYGWTHPAKPLADLVTRRAPDEPATVRESRVRDYFPPNDWNYDNGAYGWSNTEGLPGLFLQHEYLRHGNRVVYFAAEALARYSRDVITRQEGRWLGRGTRHGVQPWSDGNHDERQTTITEYRLHYFLSGEGRSRDVINHLYEHAYTQDVVKNTSFHSARLGGLLFHWEMTGDPAEREQLRRYISFFLDEKGIFVEPAVKFPGPVSIDEPGKLNSGTMFFHTFGGMHALLEYQQLVDDPEVKRALIAMADASIQRPSIEKGLLGKGDYSWPPVAYAALHADDPAPYRQFLTRYITAGAGGRGLYQPVSRLPDGPNAFMAQSVALTFFWANWAPYVMKAIGSEVWTPRIEATLQQLETLSRVRNPTGWQSDYDRYPELQSYLGSQLPWNQVAPSDPPENAGKESE